MCMHIAMASTGVWKEFIWASIQQGKAAEWSVVSGQW
jgi:hypothetical protein